MKKISLLVGAMMMAAGAFASAPSYVIFSSTGPDCYADGAPASKGEVYALVWVADGAPFEGFNADGTVVNTTTSRLIDAYAIATGGESSHCPPVMYFLDGANVGLDETGDFSVYLLDTRTFNTDGTAATVNGVDKSNGLKFTTLNSYSLAAAKIEGAGAKTLGEGLAATAAVESDVQNAPNPKITDMNLTADGKVEVVIEDTVPYLRYTISAGKTPKAEDQKDLADGIYGAANETEPITLTSGNIGEYRFFKVVRKPLPKVETSENN